MEIKINTEYIKLSQALKLSGIVMSGSEAKAFIADGIVKVNGEIVFQRGKKVYPKDIIETDGYEKITVAGL